MVWPSLVLHLASHHKTPSKSLSVLYRYSYTGKGISIYHHRSSSAIIPPVTHQFDNDNHRERWRSGTNLPLTSCVPVPRLIPRHSEPRSHLLPVSAEYFYTSHVATNLVVQNDAIATLILQSGTGSIKRCQCSLWPSCGCCFCVEDVSSKQPTAAACYEQQYR